MPIRAPAPRPYALYEHAVSAVESRAAGILQVPPCIVCDATSARPRFSIEGLGACVVVCTECGTGRMHPLPSEAELREFYPPEYYGNLGTKFSAPIEFLVRWVGDRHAAFLANRLPFGGRVLDVGCGRGVLLGSLVDCGIEAYGFEVSEAAVRGADSRAKICVAARLEDAGYPDAYFDGVILWHVLEHIRDPRSTLETIRRILRPGGRLVVAVPDFGSPQARWAGPAWFHLDLPRHLYHFPLTALRRLLERTGFEVSSEHHFSLRQNPFGWLQSWQNRRADLPRNGLYTLLYRRSPGEAPPFDARTRRRLMLGCVLGAGPAFAATLVETLACKGGTVHVVATPR
ncbi:MAG: putative S-adenosylmethionine-dependent methyltransferase [Deltaproteobacteria bacterium]|nr:putative S-adenosylmethionine-dependent methyltransferase [Deltaproteobacteria bacterium]